MLDLLDAAGALTRLPFEDGELAFLTPCPLPMPSPALLAALVAETAWREEAITLWGKRYLQPRLLAWYGTASYTYSGVRHDPLPFTPLQLALKAMVEQLTGHRFNSVLLNYYRDGRDSMGMHSDDEAELGPDPVIASLSLGATRTFILKHKQSGRTERFALPDNSLLLMGAGVQAHWQHGINKLTRPCGPRLNLTFRRIVGDGA